MSISIFLHSSERRRARNSATFPYKSIHYDLFRADYLIDRLNKYQVADKIIIELTESEGIENYQKVSRFIKDIKAMGCQIAIDDFGTGYSNFTHLIHLDVDYLKIDGSIIQNILTDKNSEIVVRTLVDFAGQLNIETIAEFVDSKEIYEKVKQLGINYT